MKITPGHLGYMQEKIAAYLTGYGQGKVLAYIEQLKADARVKDLDMRLRWDLHHASGLTKWTCDNLYSYANDTHIDTALKTIVKNVRHLFT